MVETRRGADYASRYSKGALVVTLAPDVAVVFPELVKSTTL